jgi:protoheme IX farnesyltransferase
MKSESNTLAHTISFRAIFLDFKELLKAGLAISVLFSSIAGYLLGFDQNYPFNGQF